MPTRSKRQGFFVVDIVQFDKIRIEGQEPEVAACYLALLKSTDESNEISNGGVQSIMKYTGLRRATVRRCISALEKMGLLQRLKVARPKAQTLPRYRLPNSEQRTSLKGNERKIYDSIKNGNKPGSKAEISAAYRAKNKGWLERTPEGWACKERNNSVAFIPNNFVHAREGQSLLARLLGVGELAPIMLAVELYHLQNLMDERGLSLEIIRRYFYSAESFEIFGCPMHYLKIGRFYENPETSETVAFEESYSHEWRSCGSDDFWHNLKILQKLGVVEWSVYSTHGEPPADDIYAFNLPRMPLGVLRNGQQVIKTPESIPAFLMYFLFKRCQAGGVLRETLGRLFKQWQKESPILAIPGQSVSHFEGIGTLRMSYRADTDNCKNWYRELCEECLILFFEIVGRVRPRFPEVVGYAVEILKIPEIKDAISMYLNDNQSISNLIKENKLRDEFEKKEQAQKR